MIAFQPITLMDRIKAAMQVIAETQEFAELTVEEVLEIDTVDFANVVAARVAHSAAVNEVNTCFMVLCN